MTTRKPVLIGPFSRGLNTFDDPTAIHDQECAEALNFDPGLDGSLKSRPPFTDTGDNFELGPVGSPRLLGYYYDTDGNPYLIASDGDSSTWRYYLGTWARITNTVSASDMVQFDGKAWLVAPVGSANPGGTWTPTGGFVADADMPKGASIEAYKSRLWIAEGQGGANPTRIRYSKVLGQPDFWQNAAYVDVGSGDGQSVVKVVAYFDSMLVFRSKSIWSLNYATDPALAIQGVIVPGVGLQSPHALTEHENYLYFMYDSKAYSFVNNRANQLNIKVPFKTSNPGITDIPFTVSLFNNRILYSYYENIYVYSLRTSTWTTWRSDTWGPIGQVMMPLINGTYDDTDLAYALPSSSIASSAITARNRSKNPSFGVNLDLWSPGTGSPTAVRNAGGTVPGHTTFMSVTNTTSGQSLMRHENHAATPGEVLSARVDVRVATGGPVSFRFAMNSIQGGTEGAANGTINGASQFATLGPYAASDGWVTIELPDVTVHGGSDFVRWYVGVLDGDAGDIWHADNFRFDVAPEGGGPLAEYMDGSTASSDPSVSYRWLGAAGSSASVQETTRTVSLLRIQDKVTDDSEPMTCVLQTKNYNFDVPGSFKVLFWWGIDAIFKTNIKGEVFPGVYNLSTTWRDLYSGGISWGSLLSGTWAHPYLSDPSVVSEVQTAPGPVRKFVKFFKKLRFRQIYFRITFQTDGSSAQAPVQIFTLSAYMAEKQTVVKTVS